MATTRECIISYLWAETIKRASELAISFLAFVLDRRAMIVGRMERCVTSSNDTWSQYRNGVNVSRGSFVSVFIKYMYLRFFPPSTTKS